MTLVNSPLIIRFLSIVRIAIQSHPEDVIANGVRHEPVNRLASPHPRANLGRGDVDLSGFEHAMGRRPPGRIARQPSSHAALERLFLLEPEARTVLSGRSSIRFDAVEARWTSS